MFEVNVTWIDGFRETYHTSAYPEVSECALVIENPDDQLASHHLGLANLRRWEVREW